MIRQRNRIRPCAACGGVGAWSRDTPGSHADLAAVAGIGFEDLRTVARLSSVAAPEARPVWRVASRGEILHRVGDLGNLFLGPAVARSVVLMEAAVSAFGVRDGEADEDWNAYLARFATEHDFDASPVVELAARGVFPLHVDRAVAHLYLEGL